jgi:integrase
VLPNRKKMALPRDDDASKITVGELIKRYISDPNLGGKAGRTKRYVLDMLVNCHIAGIILSELSTAHVIEHCCHRNGAGAGPATVSHDVSYLSSVLATARPVYDINYSGNPAYEAHPRLIEMGLIGKSQRRSRRPINDELDRMLAGLRKRSEHREAKIPYGDILNFSILSCMRIGKVCKLRWEDIDEQQHAVLARDRKDPRKKTGNHMLVPLLGEAWEIVQRQPKTDELIFPYNSRSVTAGFQRVRNALGIQDLRYHDMRREGASRLFEASFSIEEVAQVTGQCSGRYTPNFSPKPCITNSLRCTKKRKSRSLRWPATAQIALHHDHSDHQIPPNDRLRTTHQGRND